MSRPEHTEPMARVGNRLGAVAQNSRLMRFIVFANAAQFGMDCLHVPLT
jgi:hypothetical protein